MCAERLESEAVHVDGTSTPAAPLARVALPPALRAILLDPVLWRDSLQTYARATRLAVALTDVHGAVVKGILA